jgi:hypothetical protein
VDAAAVRDVRSPVHRLRGNRAEFARTYSQGHAFYRLSSANPTYSSSPVAHSPNIKNFTNDYLVSPPGSAQSQVFSNVDPHLLTYAADTAHFAHTTVQGPYYIGPWYSERSWR